MKLISKNKWFDKVLAVVLILALGVTTCVWGGKTKTAEAAGYVIANNGTGGISIDINAAPYSSYAQIPTWGKYAYGEEGCAWFASARVKQLTGKGSTIYSGSSWYNSAGASCGFSKGQDVKAPAIVCWRGHVAILEKVDGDTAYLSEGGITTSYKNWGTWTKIAANNGHCAIHAISVGEIKTWSYTRNDFIGFVYLPGTNTTPATPTASISFADYNLNGVTDTNAELYIKVMNPNKATVSAVGCRLYNESGNLVKEYSESCNLKTSYVNYNFNVNNDMKFTLTPGTTYKARLFAVVNGKEYTDQERVFKTTGNSDKTPPTISDVTITDVSSEGFTVKCRASDASGIARVQFPTWTDFNGQDDLQDNWGNNSKASGVLGADGFYSYRVNISDHNNERGLYYVHIYAYDKAGNQTCVPAPSTIVPEKAVATPTPVVTPKPTPVVTPEPEPAETPVKTPAVTPTPVSDNDTDKSSDIDDDSSDEIYDDEEEKVVTPSRVTGVKVTAKTGGKITVRWTKKSGISGYQVQYALNAKFASAKIKKCSRKAVGLNLKGLKKKKTYYVRVRAFNSGTYVSRYGRWSVVKKIRVKK